MPGVTKVILKAERQEDDVTMSQWALEAPCERFQLKSLKTLLAFGIKKKVVTKSLSPRVYDSK